jgi:predicted MFS family arabinose efflux permease
VDIPDRRWLILILVFACRAALGLQFQTVGSVSPQLVTDMGFGYAEIGTLIGFFMLPGLALALPAGFAGRLASDRVLVAAGLLLLGAGGLGAALAQGFGLLALGRIVAGIGYVFTTLYFAKMVVDWFSGRELATAMGALVMSWPFGVALGQVLHVWLAIRFGWPAAFVAASVHCVAGALAILVLYRPPPEAGPAPAAGLPVAEPTVPGGVASLKGFLPPVELRLTLLAAAVWGLFNAGYIVYLSFAPRLLVASGYGEAGAAAVVSVASWVMIVSGIVGGQVADRTGKPDRMLHLCLAVAVAVLLLLPLTSLAIAWSLAFGLIGMAPAGVIMAVAGEAMAPQRRAVGMGVFFSLNFLLMAAAPPLAGWLHDRTGDPYAPIVLAAALFAACIPMHLLFRRLQRQPAGAASARIA